MKRYLLIAILAMTTFACEFITSATVGCSSFSFVVDVSDIELPAPAQANTFDPEDPFSIMSIRVTDGAGNILYDEPMSMLNAVLLDEFSFSYTIDYDSDPAANPITAEIYSTDLIPEEEVILATYEGNCGTLVQVHDDYDKIGQIEVVAPGTALYEDPAGNVVRDANLQEIWVPNQTADNPYQDTYDVMAQTTIGDQIWVQIFVGNANGAVWVPVGGPVQVLYWQ